jgi:uncharacterized protein YqhQ
MQSIVFAKPAGFAPPVSLFLSHSFALISFYLSCFSCPNFLKSLYRFHANHFYLSYFNTLFSLFILIVYALISLIVLLCQR